ncbi:phage tail tube protein [Burkholderia multivorans]|uniref:Bacteriophage tail component n=1 Tax=Burkholderia multivorans (strain ATCC 17616 / 249) TaxID=395019 RepID=A0A0H3KVV6_BURM1|nr:phage tail tube protein [Burkholderia multivorans]YP_355406.1 major tail protein [Burkholderia phage Bcep176]ABA60072.1 gp70 [Burkholderia phage Bcep176]ABX17556.1 GP11 [Burkholderia multivorans ATCC 17616]PRF62459.1 phage tail protein [Burkholderia multivorans]BAG46479.1 bacteriophage tail component [Burkholderia multivorans ATCC 17616]
MAEKSKRTKAQGTKVEVSKTVSTDLDDNTLVFVDLNTTGKTIQWQGGQSSEIDATTLASEEKEYELGLPDPGEFSVDGNYSSDDEGQSLLRTARASGEKHVFRVTFADQSQFLFVGMVRQYTWSAAVDGIVTSTYSVRVSGAPKLVPPPAPPAG